jgi:hypothetical protein
MLIRTKDYVDFQKNCTLMTLKMNYTSFKNWNIVRFGGKCFYIIEFVKSQNVSFVHEFIDKDLSK